MSHTLTRESGDKLARDLRTTRFARQPQRAKNRAILSDFGRCLHFKAPSGGIPAFNTSTATLGSASCTSYTCSDSGVLTSSETVTIYNAAGAVAANAWGVAMLNDAGLWVVIVEKC